ncbi:hypothetical protein [Pedobacter sp. V48]|uniref:hypothetical protein n=1 Tax=Pedobacter sp. V48 TaxID=509635 RepID=UPI0003E4819B|nr:hypothetical protein [Pedobacter sp. V48]ETZ23848.1 hypothetical protein N824_15030 [Pedobacter sp. V48]
MPRRIKEFDVIAKKTKETNNAVANSKAVLESTYWKTLQIPFLVISPFPLQVIVKD